LLDRLYPGLGGDREGGRRRGQLDGGLQFNKAEIVECSLCGVPANPEALAKSIEGNIAFAREAIEHVLDNWARDAEGKLIERVAFEDLYRLAGKDEEVGGSIEERLARLGPDDAAAVCEKFIAAAGRVVVSRDRLDAIERAARNKRLAEKRTRELELIRARGR
jgi:hypothetical protein